MQVTARVNRDGGRGREREREEGGKRERKKESVVKRLVEELENVSER